MPTAGYERAGPRCPEGQPAQSDDVRPGWSENAYAWWMRPHVQEAQFHLFTRDEAVRGAIALGSTRSQKGVGVSKRCVHTWFNLDSPYAYRDDNLRRLGFKSYKAYMRSALWKLIRARVLEREPVGLCDRCLVRPARQVHHRAYDTKTLTGENIDSLSKVCARCHWRAERPRDMRQGRYNRLQGANSTILRGWHPKEQYQRQIKKAMERGKDPRLVRRPE